MFLTQCLLERFPRGVESVHSLNHIAFGRLSMLPIMQRVVEFTGCHLYTMSAKRGSVVLMEILVNLCSQLPHVVGG